MEDVKRNEEATQTDPLLTHSSGDLRSDFFQHTTNDVKGVLKSSRVLARQLQRRPRQAKSREELQEGTLVKLEAMPNIQILRSRMDELGERTDYLHALSDETQESGTMAESSAQASRDTAAIKCDTTQDATALLAAEPVGVEAAMSSADLTFQASREAAATKIQAMERGRQQRNKIQERLKVRARQREKQEEQDKKGQEKDGEQHDGEQDYTDDSDDNIDSDGSDFSDFSDERANGQETGKDESRAAEPAGLNLASRVQGGESNKRRRAKTLSQVQTKSKKKVSKLARLKSMAIIEARVEEGKINVKDVIADVCYYCKKPGHWKIDCPKLATDKKEREAKKRHGVAVEPSFFEEPEESDVPHGMIEGYPDTAWGQGMTMREKVRTTVLERLPGVPHCDDQCYYCRQVIQTRSLYYRHHLFIINWCLNILRLSFTAWSLENYQWS